MTEVSEDLKNLELDCCDIFKDVKYYITGEVEENVLELLKNGGAERMNYFSDYVTHLICGNEPEDTDLSDAIEVYEIPAVTVKWVIYSSHLRRLLSTKPYLYQVNKLFSNLNFCFTNIRKDYNALWAIITYHGGNVQLNLDKNCNYLVTTSTTSEKYLKASSLETGSIHIVTPDWVVESVRNKSFALIEIYHPRLIVWPKVVKHESTTAITGFEPDELNINEANLDNILPDSTQALLEELKQRMPWNQPQTSPSSEVAPPNVVAPSYTSSKLPQQLQDINQQQTVQQRLFSLTQSQLNIQKQTSQSQQQLNFLPPTSQVPRSIVHHPPQSPIQQLNQLQFSTSQQQPQQIAFSQANLTTQRLRLLEHMQQNRVQRSQFNQLQQQQQQRVQQLQQVNQLQQEGQMGQVNQQQQVVNQPPRQAQAQQVAQPNQQQQLISTNQSQENQRQLLQNIPGQQQLIQNQQLRQAQNQQVSPIAQLQMAQSQQQQQHSTLGQLAKSTPASIQQQQQHLSPQQLLQRQIQNQHLLKSQHILQNQQQQLQNQLNQQQQNQQGQTQPNQLNQQLLQSQQPQDQLQQQLSQQQSHLEQQLTQQTQLNQPQQQLNQRQLNQLNQHLLQNQLVQQNQQTQLNQQQQLRQSQQLQNRLNIQQQQQQQNKILQGQFGQPQAQQQQIINQQTVVVSQNQQTVLQQQFGSPNSQQFTQQQTFVQQQQGAFNPSQQQPQLIQTQQTQQQVIACQQPQQVQVQQQQSVQQQQQVQQQQLLAQQQLKPQQIIGQQQLVNQKLNIQQIGGQQHILLQQQQPQQVQGTQESPQRTPNQHIWQQQQQAPPPAPTPQPQQTQINIQRHPNIQAQGPRVQWAPNQQSGVVLPQRQYIHLDEQTHQQLQQMSPEDRALFVQKLHKHRVLQNRMQQQQRTGHILIRGGVPVGLNSQQQMQWLQQQAKQQGVVLQQNIQQAIPQGAIVQQSNPNLQHGAPGLSPIQQHIITDQTQQQLQLQRQQQQQLRLQQLQLHQQQQREQAQKTVLQQQASPALQQQPQPTVVRALVQGQVVEGGGVVAGPPPVVVDPNVVQSQNPLVVNSKTKTALANMLNTRLQSGGSTLSENIAEPSAAGTLKLMNAQHNAALNTGSRPHDLLFFQQRRIVNRPNGEVIRPPQAQSVPPGPQADPPKLQYSPRNTVPLQHRPGTYYGHNPNLKLPPDLFLLGCVFVVVELERFLDESMPGWQKKIEKHGGEIEKQYCNRVTHVICETQRHGVVMQALRDFKRCVTLYWLSDVINRKQVLPPWIALHLPTMYWDTAPASKHLICLTGFQGTERDRVKHMIKYIGAGLTTYFSKHNTLLITTKPEGRKYSHAKKWGVPIVNVQWLTDIMLGHFTALNQTEHVKYQHFADPPNFSFDPLLVPNLMHAWKMPINISQESYEKVKRSASPVVMPPNSKPKKIKLEQISITDENDNEEDPILQATATHRVLFSMCSDADELKKIVRQLGGVIAKSFRDCTHLIMPQLKRTHKLLCCICVGSYILPDSWLRDSHAAGTFLDESNYSLDTKEFNSEFKCDFNQTLATRNRSKLFEGKHFFITPSVVPRKKELVELAESSGGIVERNRRTLAQIEATNSSSPYSYIILTHENDLHLVADLLKNKKDKVRIVCNSELVLSAILKQTFEIEPYAVKFL